MAWSQTDVDALEAAIASGVLTVQYKDRTVTYQTTDQLLQVLATIRQSLAAAAGQTTGFIKIGTRKGFDA